MATANGTVAGSSDRGNDQQLAGVEKVNDNDIICGRGGLALKHPGNMAYRKLVGRNKTIYATCLKTEKLRISKSIIAAIREINGRFLEREDGKTSQSLDEKDADGKPITWKDIGDKRAVEKTSQALREGQPKLLKKLAQDHENPVLQAQASAANSLPMNGIYSHMGVAPQAQIISQFGQIHPMQQIMPDTFNLLQGGVQFLGQQPPVQITSQVQHRPSFTAQQRPSFTLASLVEGHTFNSFHQNGFDENNLDSAGAGPYRSNPHESWHDSWGSEDPTPLPGQASQRPYERTNSKTSHDSWGEEDPMPLPYHHVENNGSTDEHIFSSDDHKQLMTCLGVEGGVGSHDTQPDNRRPSVKFQIQPQRPSITAMSLNSHLSELSIFSDALSLDSAMEAAQREAEFDMLGEFDGAEMSIGTFESRESGNSPKPRRSILRKQNKWTTQGAAFPPAPLNQTADPGMIFTSTMDIKPGGINSGTDVSGLLGERRKSVVAFEIGVDRRRSSRMSLCSALTDFSGKYKRDIGSVLSIQSADFREILADIDDDDDDSIVENLL
mmetsp:Transcript_11199/g.27530  ORF Transcript_11199/g.27530 Transcript_11199/m.27530 type:complete len:552 (-) Transcript_11199:185-1840(-)